jgi:hypothetical protein
MTDYRELVLQQLAEARDWQNTAGSRKTSLFVGCDVR